MKPGDSKICRKCRIEIHVAQIEFQGESRLSWRNPDGSPHFYFEEGTFLHCPTRDTPTQIAIKEIRDDIHQIKEMLMRG